MNLTGGMLVVVGYEVIRINKLGAVWNLAPIIGETILVRDNIDWPGRSHLKVILDLQGPSRKTPLACKQMGQI